MCRIAFSIFRHPFYFTKYLILPVQVGLVGGACADVVQTFYRASKYEKKDKFISILNEDGRNANERTLVFVETKRQADFLCLNLCEEVLA